jgi:hypothetical protein
MRSSFENKLRDCMVARLSSGTSRVYSPGLCLAEVKRLLEGPGEYTERIATTSSNGRVQAPHERGPAPVDHLDAHRGLRLEQGGSKGAPSAELALTFWSEARTLKKSGSKKDVSEPAIGVPSRTSYQATCSDDLYSARARRQQERRSLPTRRARQTEGFDRLLST